VAGDNQSPCDDPSFLLASTARLDSRRWFQQDKFQGNPHIVAQWADLHNAVAQAGDLRMLLIALNRSLNEPLTQCTRDGTPLFMALIFVKRLSLYSTPPRKRWPTTHLIADSLSAHRTSRVWQFIDRHRKVRIHFTPTYSSWLNQVETWFSKIQRDVIARGIFRSVKDLAKKDL
jgi:DDE superfamily endonuclease